MRARRTTKPGANPFMAMSAPASTSTVVSDEAPGEPFVRGPVQPVMAPPVEIPVLGRRRPGDEQPLLWVAGCHGGAGASSLQAALGETVIDAERTWPAATGPGQEPQVLLVARTSFAGLGCARLAAQEWASGALPWVKLLGLVLIADAPGVHRDVRGQVEQVLRLTPRGWYLPWQESWRALPVTDRPTDRQTSKILRSIKRAAQEQ